MWHIPFINLQVMKAIIIILNMILFCNIMFAQTKTEVFFGEPGRYDFVKDIIELYDHGYYVSGGFEGGDGTYKGWGIKTDINIEMAYDKVMEHTLGDVAISSTISDINGNIYLTGLTPSDSQWPSVFKFDSCGNKVWCKLLDYGDEFNYGYGMDIILTDNDEVVVLAYLLQDGQVDMIHLIGLNTDGEVLWKKPYASKNDYPWIDQAIGYDVTEIDDNYYISGFCYWPYPDEPDHVFLRPLFIGIDSLFNEKWILPFAPLDSVFGDAYKTIPLNDSVFMGIGERWLGDNDKNTVLMFFNDDGETLGYNQIPDDSIAPNLIANVSRDIQRINDSLFITFSVWGSTPDGGICSEMVIDTSGKIYNINESTFCTGSGSLIKTYNDNYVYAVTVEEGKSDNDIYVYKIDENLNDVPFDPTQHNYDSLCPGGIQSGITDLSDCLVWTNISEAPGPAEYYESVKWVPIRAWPNPSGTGLVSFGFENTGYFAAGAAAAYTYPSMPPKVGKCPVHSTFGHLPTLSIFNIVGEQVHSERIYRFQEETTVNVNSWEKGMYFAVVHNKGKVVGKCKFVVQ